MTRSLVTNDRVVLTVATGSVCAAELAILVRCLTSGLLPAATAAVLGAFHMGYLVADRMRSVLPMPALLVALGMSSAALALSISFLSPTEAAIAALAGAGLAFNSAAQAVRRNLKGRTALPIRVKNISKAVGMAIGGASAADTWASAAWLVLVCVMCLYAAGTTRHLRVWPVHREVSTSPRRDGALLAAELLHHAHYFAYVYTFWFLAPSLIGPLTGVWFLVGWLAYFVAEGALRTRGRAFSPTVMAIGHLTVAVMVLSMPHLPPAGVLIAWFLTGIGGGTAYMLGNVQPQGNREFYEDVGHVTGAVVAAAAAGVAGGTPVHSATASLIAAASLACAAAGAFWLAKARLSRRSHLSEGPSDLTCA